MWDKLTPTSHTVLSDAVKDNKLTPDEESKVRTVLKNLDSAELDKLDQVVRDWLRHIIAELHPESAEALWPIPYSLSWIKERVKDKDTKMFLEMFEKQIAGDLWELYPNFESLDTGWKETIKLVFWKIIQDQIGFAWAVNIGTSQFTDFTSWFTEIFWEAEESEDSEWSIITRSMREKFSGEHKKAVVGEIWAKLFEDVEKTIVIIESIIWKEATNLETLFRLTDSMGDEKNAIFENPVVLESIMKTGTYKQQGFDINLEEGKVVIWEVADLPEVQQKYIKELEQQTQWFGKTIEKMKKWANKFDNLLAKLGMEWWLDEVKKMLFWIPIIWIFFKMLFGGFLDKFWDANHLASVERALALMSNKNAWNSIQTLRKYIPTYVEKHEDSALTKIVSTFPSPDFITGTTDFFTLMDNEGVKTTDPNFWKQVLTGEWADGKVELIHEQVKWVLGKTTITEKDIITVLGGITAESLIVEKTTPTDTALIDVSAAAGAGATAGTIAKGIAPKDDAPKDDAPEILQMSYPSYEFQLSRVSWLPAKIIDEKTWRSIDVWSFHAQDSSIDIDGKKYYIGLKVEITGPDLVIILTNLNLNNNEASMSYIDPDWEEGDKIEGKIQTLPVSIETITEMLRWVINTWEFIGKWQTKDKYWYNLSVSPTKKN